MAGLLIVAGAVVAAAAITPAQFQFLGSQANATLQGVSLGNFPANGACQGCYNWSVSNAGGWTAGFFAGVLLKLYNVSLTLPASDGGSQSSWWLEQGSRWAYPLAVNENNTSTHDVGFMVLTSLGQLTELTGNTTSRAITIRTAHSLATRFSPLVGCIESWGTFPPTNDRFEVIVDNMLNLELLWWAANTTGNSTLLAMATSHADHMIRDIFQPSNPGCVWHLIVYNYSDASIISRTSTPQGLGNNTVWARGQGWSTLGFMIAYRYTLEPRYLIAAQNSADCFIRLLQASACCSGDFIPLWDFNATAPGQYGRDSSAAMIAADGMIEIAWHTADPAQRARYLAAAQRILASAWGAYKEDPVSSPAFLRNGTTTFPQTGIPIVYGDYYGLEAQMKWDATPQQWREEASRVKL